MTTLYGTNGNDTLTGGSDGDSLYGYDGHDTLYGGAGNDYLVGGSGNNTLDGGDGDSDQVEYSESVTVNLSSGTAVGATVNDILIGIERVFGSYYNDTLIGDSADNVLYGYSGNDTLYGGMGNDFLAGDLGNNTLDGGEGTDSASYSGAVSVNLAAGTASGTNVTDTLINIENLYGSAYNDTLTGNSGDNYLAGGGGEDVIVGGSGNDTLRGYGYFGGEDSDGSDFLYGESGNDYLYGDKGNDNLDGGTGNNTLDGGSGTDTATYSVATFVNLAGGTASGTNITDTLISIENVNGSSGDDSLYGNSADNVLKGGAGNNTVSGGDGNDTLYGGGIYGSKGSNDGTNYLYGDAGNDTLYGGTASDYLNGGTGINTLDGGSGTDTATYSMTITANLATGTATGTNVTDTLFDIENINGSSGGDTLTGNSADNVLKGGAGNNTVSGGDGNDTLYGGGIYGNKGSNDGTNWLYGDAGNDTLYGGTASDDLNGGTGINTLDGGEGTDTATYSVAITANLATGTATGTNVTDTLVNIENLYGSAYNDTLTGNSEANNLDGSNGNDTLYGNDGNDTLYGGKGTDSLYGGKGQDTFVISNSSNDTSLDTIADFVAGGSGDVLKIPVGLFTNYTTGANPFTTGHARLTQSGADTFVELDKDGSGSGAFQTAMILKNVTNTSLVASNLNGFSPTTTSTTPTYSLASGASSFNEGASATFTLTTTNVTNGTVLPYTLSGTVNAADITGGGLSGNVTVNNNTATITVGLVADASTEGTETLTVSITGASASTSVADTSTGPTPTGPLTTAKIYLGPNDNFAARTSGITAYGGSGNDTITIGAGVTNVTLDQSIERIILSGQSSAYTFKQTGNQINVYDSEGATLLAKAPLQGDADGTVLTFGNGSAAALLQTGGVMRLGGVTVSSATATALSPTLGTNPDTPSNTTTAKAYLGANDTLTVSNIGLTVYGAVGTEVVTLGSGAAGVVLDQSIERINFPNAGGSYTFKQTGNQINVYDSTGTTLLAKTPVQGDADGTVLSFAGQTYSALLQSGGVMKLGTFTVNASTPTALLSGASTVAVSAAGTSSASGADVTFNVALGSYTHTISGFGAGDKIVGPSGVAGSLSNTSFTDGMATLQYAQAGQTVQITLTGLTTAQDGALFSATDFNSVFGAGTIA